MNLTEKLGGCLLIVLGFIGLALALSVILAIPVWFLWNWLMPAVFGLAKVTLWQAWGLALLSSLLLKSSAGKSS